MLVVFCWLLLINLLLFVDFVCYLFGFCTFVFSLFIVVFVGFGLIADGVWSLLFVLFGYVSLVCVYVELFAVGCEYFVWCFIAVCLLCVSVCELVVCWFDFLWF